MSLSVCLSVDEIVFMHVYEQISDNRDTQVYVRPYGRKRMAVFAGRILLPGAWPCGVSLCLATQSWNETAEELPETPYP